MLEQIGWQLLKLTMLVVFLAGDYIFGSLLILAMKDRDYIPAVCCATLGLGSFGCTFWVLGWLTGW